MDTNTAPPFLGPTQPVYPPLYQLLRATQGTVPGPSGYTSSSVIAASLYVAFTQQLRNASDSANPKIDNTLFPRDREPCLALDVGGFGLAPGYYLGRLSGSWTGLPVYEVVGGSGSGGFIVGAPGSSSAPVGSGLTQDQVTKLLTNLSPAQLSILGNLTPCQLQTFVQLNPSQMQSLTLTLSANQLAILVDALTFTQLSNLVFTLSTSQTLVVSSAFPALYALVMQSLTLTQATSLLNNLTSQQFSTLLPLTGTQLQTVAQLTTSQVQTLTGLTATQVGTLVGQLTSTQLSGLLTTLSTSQLQQLTNALTSDQVGKLALSLSSSQIQGLTTGLTTGQLQKLVQYPAATIGGFTTTLSTSALGNFLNLQGPPPSPILGNQAGFPYAPVVVGQPSSTPASFPGYAPVVVDSTGKLWAYAGGAWTNLSSGSGGARTEGTLTATGNSQGTAAQIITDAVVVSGADGTKGVILPNVVAEICVVRNNDNVNTLKVYPPSGAAISTLGTNNADSVLNNIARCYLRVSSTQWHVFTLS